MLFKYVIVFVITSVVLCGCGVGKDDDTTYEYEMTVEQAPSTADYTRQAQKHLSALKLSGGLDDDIPTAVSRMADRFQTASDEEKIRLYKAIGGTPEVKKYKLPKVKNTN